MKKKNIIISGLLTAALLAGCGGESHTHTAQGGWDWNGVEHWNVCECGEIMDMAAHKTGDDLVCTGCGAEVWVMDDGSADVYSYDEHGNPLRNSSFDPAGNLLSENKYEYEYDENGNMMLCRVYADGELQAEDIYMLHEEGYSILEKSLMYNEGECTLNQYDVDGNVIYVKSEDADGNVTFESWSEYDINNDGEFYESKSTQIDGDGTKLVAEYDIYGGITRREWYDADGNPTRVDTWEYTYNQDGQELWHKEYRDGVLVYEVAGYAEIVEDGYSMRYAETIIEYYEDGTKLVQVNGENGELAMETLYNADSSEIYTRTYAYETFEDGNWKSIKVYQDDKLVQDTQYVMEEGEDWSHKDTETTYHEDGTYTVITFDASEEAVSEITFDANGNVIEKP